MLLLSLHDGAINSSWVNKYSLPANALPSPDQAAWKNGYLISSLHNTIKQRCLLCFVTGQYFLLWKVTLFSQKTFNISIPQTLRNTDKWLYRGHSSKLCLARLWQQMHELLIKKTSYKKQPLVGHWGGVCCLLEFFLKCSESSHHIMLSFDFSWLLKLTVKICSVFDAISITLPFRKEVFHDCLNHIMAIKT